jgi:polyphosphate kinase
MNRNLDWRVEAITPVENRELRERLREILDVMRHHTDHSWQLGSDGNWRRRVPQNGDKASDAQVHLMAQALKEARKR